MADSRIERKSITITPTSKEGIAPLNGHPTPVDPFCEDEYQDASVDNNQDDNIEEDNIMNKSSFELQLSYDDVLDFLRGDHCLLSLIDELKADSENLYNPPTQDEFVSKLNFAIRRKEGKIDESEIATAEARAKGRVLSSPVKKSEYADPLHKAFPVDSKKRAVTAHAYIHKYWNDASKKGVTATYGRDDFVKIHNKIVKSMTKFGVQHHYLDSLDDASGYKKGNDGLAVKKSVDNVAKKENAKKSAVKMSFNFAKNQTVVSWSRNRMRESGIIKDIDDVVATVQWECGLVTTEPLAGLFPKK